MNKSEFRLMVAREVLEAGGNLTRFAEKLQITPAAALRWLDRNAPAVHVEFQNAPRPGLTAHQALVRLLLMREARKFPGGVARLARAFRMTPGGLYETCKRWAPDGMDKAIEDLWPRSPGG